MRNTCSERDCGRPAFGKGLCSKHYQIRRYHGTLPTEPPSRQCEQCGILFDGRKWNARYCSKACNEQARFERTRKVHFPDPVLVCEQCGTRFEKRRIDARFCSDKCGQDWRNARIAAATLARKASRPPCHGCGGPVAPERPASAMYCTEECKIRSRRHEAYGLTKRELDFLLAQHEVCAICRTNAWGLKGPQVDHDHVTSRVRGVLCGNCNQGLGRFADDPARLRAAAEYLETAATPVPTA